MFRFLSRLFVPILLAGALIACDDADTDDANQPDGNYDPDFGFYVTNEGRFTGGNGTVSYYSRQRNTIANDIYGVANGGAATGDVVQSMTLRGDRAYIVVNNSNVVRIVNANTFVDEGNLSLPLPRFVHIASDTAGYITQYATGFDTLQGRLRVFNPGTRQLGRTVALTISPGRILRVDNELWLLPELSGRRIARLSLSGHSLIGYLPFANSIRGAVRDNAGRIWVANGRELARLTTAGAVEQRLTFSGNVSHLSLGNGGTVLYFQLPDGVYRATTAITATTGAQPIIATRTFSTLAWDPATEHLLAGVTPSFTSAGRILRYASATGTLVDSFTVGVAPNGFVLR